MHFEVLAPITPPALPLVVHVPHGSLRVAPEYRDDFVLGDVALQEELLKMTDRYTDDLGMSARLLGGTVFVNRISRLVMDPERFADDAEEAMSKKGMGAIYRLRQDGTPLRRLDFTEAERAARVRDLYEPYHRALSQCVADLLSRHGTCLLIDLHSYPRVALPYEDAAAERPQICLGYEEAHDDPELRAQWTREIDSRGWTAGSNSPFAGSLVPSEFYRKDRRVRSLMVELRRDLYMDETTGGRNENYHEVERFVSALFGCIR